MDSESRSSRQERRVGLAICLFLNVLFAMVIVAVTYRSLPWWLIALLVTSAILLFDGWMLYAVRTTTPQTPSEINERMLRGSWHGLTERNLLELAAEQGRRRIVRGTAPTDRTDTDQ